jgi:hypothetical protein
MDAKRQNKLLKLAIGRLQNELDEKENGEKMEAQMDDNAYKAKTFLTESVTQAQNDPRSQLIDNTTTTAPNSIYDVNALSKFSTGPGQARTAKSQA